LIIYTDTTRPLVRNTTQFNGEFVCNFCFILVSECKKEKGVAGYIRSQIPTQPSSQDPWNCTKRTSRGHGNRDTDRTELELDNGPDQVSYTKRRPNKKNFNIIILCYSSLCMFD
jgi:hypothetical protein